jgi:hypothetical protein
MMTHTDFFGCKHPIVCLPMNGVSDLNLAVAVSKAGALPSLSIPNYMSEMGNVFRTQDLARDLFDFADKTGTNNLMLSVSDDILYHNRKILYDLFEETKLTHIEIFLMMNNDTHGKGINDFSDFVSLVKDLKSIGLKVVVKSIFNSRDFPYDPHPNFWRMYPVMDGVLFKGREGAGKISNKPISLSYMLDISNRFLKDKATIVSGGISTNEQIMRYLKEGATAVGIGTLFALSEESHICQKSKQAVINENSRPLDKMRSESAIQNAFIFSEYSGIDNTNNSESLTLGINGNGGHLFVGEGKKFVNEILPVAEIVARLMNANYPVFHRAPAQNNFA